MYEARHNAVNSGRSHGWEQAMSAANLSSACFRFTEAARQLYGRQADQYCDYLFRTDPLADVAVAAIAELPGSQGHRMLDKALNEGIDAVPDAPLALRDL